MIQQQDSLLTTKARHTGSKINGKLLKSKQNLCKPAKMEDVPKSRRPVPQLPSPRGQGSSQQKEKGKRRGMRNPYRKIINQLPQEIKEKLDWSKENIDDMCSTLTLPHEYKPGLVIKWIKKVSENELNKIHEEILNIKLNERKLKRTQRFSMESLEARGESMQSHRSDSSSRYEKSSRHTAKIINYNVAVAEGNSAWSKTSSNTKPSPNLVRIPLNVQVSKTNREKDSEQQVPFYLKNEPKIVSINPGKSILLKFENANSKGCDNCVELKCKRNILNTKKAQDIVIENFVEHSIHIFSSVGGDQRNELLDFNWASQNESQDLNREEENYMKQDVNDRKFINLDQSNISQMIESVEEYGDYYLQKQLLPRHNDPMKSFNMGGPSLIMSQFCNNITPVFSITEDLPGQIRPNILESNDITNPNLGVSHNLPAFACNADGDILLTEDFKSPIDAHNQ